MKRGRRHLWTGVLVGTCVMGCRRAPELPPSHAVAERVDDVPALAVVFGRALSDASVRGAVCVKVRPREFRASPFPIPASWSAIPDPEPGLFDQLRAFQLDVHPGSTCRLDGADTTDPTGTRKATQLIMFAPVWAGPVGAVDVFFPFGPDDAATTYCASFAHGAWRADRCRLRGGSP